MRRNQTERRTENVHDFDFIFSVSVAEFQNTTGNFNKICTYANHVRCINLVIMRPLMACPARQLCDYFTSTILLTTDFCGTIPRPTVKTTNLMHWHGTICILNVFLLSEREISPNYAVIFLDFVHGFGSYVKGLPKTKRCNSVAVTVSVRFRFGFGV